MKSAIRDRTEGALIRIASPVYGSVLEASDLLMKHVQAMHPVLAEDLPD